MLSAPLIRATKFGVLEIHCHQRVYVNHIPKLVSDSSLFSCFVNFRGSNNDQHRKRRPSLSDDDDYQVECTAKAINEIVIGNSSQYWLNRMSALLVYLPKEKHSWCRSGDLMVDEERASQHLKEINSRIMRRDYDPERDNIELASVMLEVLMFTFLVMVDDQSFVAELQIFTDAIDNSRELTV